MHRFRPRLGYANAPASLTLFLALGGGAYAAGTQPAKTGPRITTVSVPSDVPARTLVARAGGVRLETAGIGYALRVRNDTPSGAHFACQGMTEEAPPAPILAESYVPPGQTQQVVTNAQAPAFLTCRIADLDTGGTTEVLIGRGQNAVYAGHAISDGVQQ